LNKIQVYGTRWITIGTQDGNPSQQPQYPKTGQFQRVTGTPEQIDEALKSPNAFWIYTKDPRVQAFPDLLNRALGKPAHQVSLTGQDNGPVIFRWQQSQ